MNIDAHVHLWRLARGDNVTLSPAEPVLWRDYEPSDLKPLLEATGSMRSSWFRRR